MATTTPTVRLVALADLHVNASTIAGLRDTLVQAGQSADVLLLPGDLTDYGLPEEAHLLARELAGLRIPCLAVLGNHDYQADRQHEVRDILRGAGVIVLDGDAHEAAGIGFAGIKGFIGGFDHRVLAPWGEASIKNLVHEAIEESLKLESALAKLRTPQRVAVLHYAPIRATVEGEPLEIFPFLGSSRFEEPLDRYRVTAVFHGHAHRGTVLGRTRGQVPVYNVSLPLLRRSFPDRPPFYVLELPVEPASGGTAAVAPA